MIDSIKRTNELSSIVPNILAGLSYELKNYIEYKNRVNSGSNYKSLEFETLITLENMGYPINDIGIYYFRDLIVRACVLKKEGINDTDLCTLLDDKFSQFYFDVARNENDIGIKNFNRIIGSCLEKRNKSADSNKLAFKIMKKLPEDNSLGTNIFYISGYVYGEYNSSKNQGNQYVKKINSKDNI